ncbi:ATP-binding cassette domain-containing protein [Pseudactinotalea sp. Z1732]|uniref:ABC transporter ATP-binding protein n=1 Tax=Micrococcales TaxID=85006 RepID=UPI003C7B14C3
MNPAIEIRNLVKTFGPTRALDGVDLTVQPGQVHGFLGPNGAGKSTTIRVLLGLLRPDSGTATVLGEDAWSDAVTLHHRLAYVPGDVSLWPNLTGGEAIDLFARLRGTADRHRRDDLIERFDLDPTKKGRTYSKGNRQKVAIVAALAADVELLVLDEPTSGLDPLMEAVFAEVIAEENARGRTVLLSSHTLAQVEKLCEHISIIRSGRIVESGSLAQMRHLMRTTVDVVTAGPVDLSGVAGVHDLADDDEGALRMDVDTEHLDEVIGHLHAAGIRSLQAHPPTLEQLFMRHYGSAEAGVEGAADDAATARTGAGTGTTGDLKAADR